MMLQFKIFYSQRTCERFAKFTTANDLMPREEKTGRNCEIGFVISA